MWQLGDPFGGSKTLEFQVEFNSTLHELVDQAGEEPIDGPIMDLALSLVSMSENKVM